MAISKVRATQPFPEDNFAGQNGYLFAYRYWFEDGTFGVAKHQTDAPRFQNGEEVEYSITRQHKGVNQLKLDKVGHGDGGHAPPQQTAPPPARTGGQTPPAPAQSASRFLGATIGNALGNAVLLLSHGVEQRLEKETTAHAVYRVASQLLLVAETIQGGRLYGEKVYGEKGQSPQQPPQSPPAPPQNPPAPPPAQSGPPQPPPPAQNAPPAPRQQPLPGPDGLAFDPSQYEEDVPF